MEVKTIVRVIHGVKITLFCPASLRLQDSVGDEIIPSEEKLVEYPPGADGWLFKTVVPWDSVFHATPV